ncbi:MAG: hypothetical protein IIC84_05005, partial [Chloroflexi bacterium]|nr:hypothetical protein [Chloroflexota bacterium]
MASSVSKTSKLASLGKILRQEKADGFQDKTVMGGLDKFLQLGADELEPVLGKPGSYSILTPPQRETWANAVMRHLTDAVPSDTATKSRPPS